MPIIDIKRVYDPPAADDGTRVLVDRLWPRGLTKDRAAIDFWAKDLSPSHELRRWFAHKPEHWEEFLKRFREELGRPRAREEIEAVQKLARKGPVTLVFAAREEEMNNAAALRDYLAEAFVGR
ncbi:MAG: hypothetical protein CTY15_00520 [Methylocystis sp.]|nr:MAG: hypothetical protein CTY15_00520 [Methylocystis sp.]